MTPKELKQIFKSWNSAWHGNGGINTEIEIIEGVVSYYDKFNNMDVKMTVKEFKDSICEWFSSFVFERSINEKGEINPQIMKEEIEFIKCVLMEC